MANCLKTFAKHCKNFEKKPKILLKIHYSIKIIFHILEKQMHVIKIPECYTNG